LGLVLVALVAISCSKAGPLDDVDAPGIVAADAEQWGFEYPSDESAQLPATDPLGVPGIIWFEADDVKREDEDGYTRGHFDIVERWAGEAPTEVLVHWTQERQFHSLVDDGARVMWHWNAGAASSSPRASSASRPTGRSGSRVRAESSRRLSRHGSPCGSAMPTGSPCCAPSSTTRVAPRPRPCPEIDEALKQTRP
jgi:hypothetical protein